MNQLGFVVLNALCSMAFAQPQNLHEKIQKDLAGTFAVLPLRESADGQLLACGLEFSALTPDRSTKRGAPVKIIGSYYLRTFPVVGLGYSLKLGIYDGLTWTNPSPPNNAFVRSLRGRSPATASRLLAETPGFALFFGPLDNSFDQTLAEIVDEGKLVVGFNRAVNQQDVVLTLDLHVENTRMVEDRVVRTRSTWMVDEFSACVEELIKSKTKK
ncbi:hypothetical protein ACSFA3_21675 [Variovorax sp. RHLX14]|uniref:hypothetical protein n=1 Tax=Variovorax sp. RHLX14 TaxID=1259731 RepID=UPI003F47EA43